VFLYTPVVSKQEESKFTQVIEDAHVYSGLNSEYFMKFVNNLELFEDNVNNVHLAATYLYRAIGSLEELAMYGAQDEIHALIPTVGITGERILMRQALQNNMAFNPTYLKNTI
jgi:hypothetical protein